MPKTPQFTPDAPRRIEILCYPDVQLLDVAGPLQVFATANDQARFLRQPEPYVVRVVGALPSTRTSSGLPLGNEPLTSAGELLDTLIVPGGFGVYPACEDKALLDWIDKRGKDAKRLASVCSGAFLIATLGLLDGRRAVTHWGRCADFRKRFPKVKLDPDPIFIKDGRVWTSAGVTAGIDLALAFVEEDCGLAMALGVARQLVVFLKRPGGQSQFSTALSLQEGDDHFVSLHAYMAGHLSADLSVPVLAAQAGMSERNFQRLYRKTIGLTPARAVEKLRLEAARQRLEAGESVKRVANACGFGTEETLRRVFLRALSVTPQAYRQRFATTSA
jgi:transcriptional regulator GlxA family with amidase domain